MKFRWLGAIGVYLGASIAVLFAPWPDSADRGREIGSDWQLILRFASGGNVVEIIRVVWILPILAASAVLWLSARRGISGAHAELSLALALGAAAYPFASFPEPGCPSLWVGSSAAAFVVTFAGVLGWKAVSRQRPEYLPAPRGTTPML